MDQFNEPTHTETAGEPQRRTRHAMFHSFLSDDRKQDSATIISHRKLIIELLKQQNIMLNMLSTIWENTDACAEQYICVTALYLMSF